MSQNFIETFRNPLQSTQNGITHPFDEERFHRSIFTMIQDGLSPSNFEGLRRQFEEVIQSKYPGSLQDISNQLSSNFYAMYYAVNELNKIKAIV